MIDFIYTHLKEIKELSIIFVLICLFVSMLQWISPSRRDTVWDKIKVLEDKIEKMSKDRDKNGLR